MNCEDVQKQIPLLCGEDLSPETDRQALEEHVAECPSCAAELREFRESRQVFDQLRAEGMPDGFWNGFQEDLHEELSNLPSPAERRTAGSPPNNGRRVPATVSTGLFAAAIFLIGIGLGYFGTALFPSHRTSPATPTETSDTVPDNSTTETVQQEPDTLQDSSDNPPLRTDLNRNTAQEIDGFQSQPIYQQDPVLPDPLSDVNDSSRRDDQSAEK